MSCPMESNALLASQSARPVHTDHSGEEELPEFVSSNYWCTSAIQGRIMTSDTVQPRHLASQPPLISAVMSRQDKRYSRWPSALHLPSCTHFTQPNRTGDDHLVRIPTQPPALPSNHPPLSLPISSYSHTNEAPCTADVYAPSATP